MSKMPMIRQMSLLGSIPNLTVFVLFLISGLYVSNDYGHIIGAIAFLTLSFSLRLLPQDHRKGIKLVHQQQFQEAIPHFLRSYEFFAQRQWLDKYRAFLLLSASAISFQEMALVNTAFCFSQIGDGASARKYYEQCLALFPDSRIATAALKMMNLA